MDTHEIEYFMQRHILSICVCSRFNIYQIYDKVDNYVSIQFDISIFVDVYYILCLDYFILKFCIYKRSDFKR